MLGEGSEILPALAKVAVKAQEVVIRRRRYGAYETKSEISRIKRHIGDEHMPDSMGAALTWSRLQNVTDISLLSLESARQRIHKC